MFASMLTLLEALTCGVKRYGLSLDTVGEAVNPSIGRDFTILFGEFDVSRPRTGLVESLESRISTSDVYAASRMTVRARGARGEELGTLRWGTAVTSGAVARDYVQGPPATIQEAIEIGSVESHLISAPKFERELFLRTVELAGEYNILPKDAMHILYVTGHAENIVTTDKRFLAALNAKDG